MDCVGPTTMNVMTPGNTWAVPLARGLSDEKMDQVREILIGDYRRQADVQIAAMDARLRELETVMTRRLDDLEARLQVLQGRVGEDRRGAFEELSRGVAELGQRIREIAR
jgi:hypothetical protein